MRQKVANLRGVFTILLIVAAAVYVVAALYFQPWGSKLGVPASPQRIALASIFGPLVMGIPVTLLVTSIVAGQPKWVAPRGRYVEGQDPKLFTPYTYTAIAFCAALFAAAGIGNFQVVDLPAGAAALGCMYFNPIIGWFTLWLGGILRAMIFGSGNPVQWAYSWGIFDGSLWICMSLFYWFMREKTKFGKNPVILTVIWAVFYFLWRTVYTFLIIFWYLPSNMYAPTITNQWTAQFPTGLIASIAVMWVVEAIIRATERRADASKAAPAA